MTELTRRAVEDLYGAYMRGDFDRVARLIDDDIDWIIYGPIQILPFAGERRGKRAVLETLGRIAAEYTLQNYKPEIIVVEGERAAVMSDVAFTQRSTGRLMRFRVVNFLRFRDGRIVEFRELFNTFDVVEQALGRELHL